MIKFSSVLIGVTTLPVMAFTQVKWSNVDGFFQPLPKSVHVYYTEDSIEGKPNIAYYVSAGFRGKSLRFSTDTTYKRRMTPAQFFKKNNQPLIVVNGTFFSFETNSNLNVVIKNKKVIAHNTNQVKVKDGDTTREVKVFRSAIGIKGEKADVAWIRTDSASNRAWASQQPEAGVGNYFIKTSSGQNITSAGSSFKKWKMETAIGGGPVLVQNGQIKITNNEERMFAGKAVNDRHPRTAMGYTSNGELIILVVQGRSAGKAEGVSLVHTAKLLRDIGCIEALNLDGGGSSCLLINGKETIKPSDPTGQRPVPAVFIISRKKN